MYLYVIGRPQPYGRLIHWSRGHLRRIDSKTIW